MGRVGETDTAWPHRNAAAMILLNAFWPEASGDEIATRATRRLFSAVEPFTGGYYTNVDSDGANVSSNYGPVYERLVLAKNVYDPTNLYRLNSNVRPNL